MPLPANVLPYCRRPDELCAELAEALYAVGEEEKEAEEGARGGVVAGDEDAARRAVGVAGIAARMSVQTAADIARGAASRLVLKVMQHVTRKATTQSRGACHDVKTARQMNGSSSRKRRGRCDSGARGAEPCMDV